MERPGGGERKPQVPVGKKQRLIIERLANDGRGIAFIEGRTWFVEGALAGEEAFENFLLQQAQLAVGHDQEVAAAAAGVQKAELFEAAVQGIEAGAALAGGDQFPAQLIEK